MPLFKCAICQKSRGFFKPLCNECRILFALVQENLGKTGLGQLMDVLIATGIDKRHIKLFLENNPHEKGSILDQITAELTNNLAAGIGVKGADISPADVQRIRNNPGSGVATKPIDS